MRYPGGTITSFADSPPRPCNLIEYIRRASIHSGEMAVGNAVAAGDRSVAFAWDWEDFASGTAILHLRNGRIAVAVLSVTESELEPQP